MSGPAPGSLDALAQRAARALNAGRPAEALPLLEQGLAQRPDQPTLLSLKGVALAALGRAGEALEAAERAVALAPRWADGHANLAHVLTAAGRGEDCEAALRRALELQPGHVIAALNLGNLLARAGRLPEAIERFRAVLRREPSLLAARYNLALALQQAGESEAALAEFRAILARHPNHAEAANHAAAILMAQLRHDEAVTLLDALLAREPGHARSHNNRGTALRALGRSAEALESYRAATRLRPDHADAWRNLGLMAADQGLTPEALAAFRQALALKPGDPVATHMLDALEGRTTARPPRAYVARSFDAFADSFDSQLESLGYGVPRELAALAAAVAPQRRFEQALDLGCGTGLVAAAFAERVASWTGVDLSPRMLERAAARGLYARLAEADVVEFLETQPERYGLVTAADVLIYLGDLAPLFAAVAARLEPGGLFLCSIEREPEGGADSRITGSGRYAQSESYLRRLAAGAGLEVLRASPAVLRHEHQRPVEGLLLAFARP